MTFHVASIDDIRDGKVTDVYFARTLEILKAKGVDKPVRAEFFAKKLPKDWGWGVFAGAEEVARLMEGKKVSIRGIREGEVFRPWEPVLEIEGNYQEICLFETAMLGLICQASGVATSAARMKKAAGDRLVASFGARRMHPAVAPMVERAAYLGGCDGVAVVASADLMGIEATGTMPHALVLVLGDTVEAARAFDEVVDEKVKRVALIDTFNDEKFEAIRVAEATGGKVFALRLDTPATRRGDFYRIFEEVRWELDLRGYGHIKLFASGGLDEEAILELKPLVDAFGVGTSISNAPVVDYAMDIMEIEGKPVAKRGKWSGAKDLLFCVSCGARKVVPMGTGGGRMACACGGERENLFIPLLDKGEVARDLPSATDIREFSLGRTRNIEI